MEAVQEETEVQPIEEARPVEQPKHLGFVTISRGLMQALELELPEPVLGTLPTTAVQAHLKRVAKKLLLPKAYRVTKVFYNAMQGTWLVMIEGESIPLVPEGADMPRIDLWYNRHDETGKVTLLSIKAVYTQQVTVELL